MTEIQIGTVEHYYPNSKAAIVKLDRGALRVGDHIHIVGPRDDLREEVSSLESEHRKIKVAGVGSSVGLGVDQPVHDGAQVFKVTEAPVPRMAATQMEMVAA